MKLELSQFRTGLTRQERGMRMPALVVAGFTLHQAMIHVYATDGLTRKLTGKTICGRQLPKLEKNRRLALVTPERYLRSTLLCTRCRTGLLKGEYHCEAAPLEKEGGI